MDFYFLSACISNAAGELQFYSNGCYIANRNEQLMGNGDHLNPGPMYDSWCFDGNDYPAGMQGMLILPCPDTAGIYYVFHKRIEFWPTNAELATPALLKACHSTMAWGKSCRKTNLLWKTYGAQ
ncbi:MAG: hypothetical protein IPK76_09555 [Lewinellaceae bacterium]|nr:hypothetical protein [Lewinellaceae bacterium]